MEKQNVALWNRILGFLTRRQLTWILLSGNIDGNIEVMWYLFLQIVSGILGLWLADKFIPGVDFKGSLFILPIGIADLSKFLNTLTFAGILLGILNFAVKPILKKITFPLRIITFNLFSLVIAMFLVWLVDIFSPELIIQGLKPLFFTTIIVLAINLILSKWWPEKHANHE